MSTMQESAVAAGYVGLLAVAGKTVRYRRGATVLQLRAVPTKRRLALAAGAQAAPAVGHDDLDWLVRRADLVLLAGEPADPQRGDRIEEVDAGGVTWIYETCNPDGGPCWTFQDPGRVLLRIHTERLSRA